MSMKNIVRSIININSIVFTSTGFVQLTLLERKVLASTRFIKGTFKQLDNTRVISAIWFLKKPIGSKGTIWPNRVLFSGLPEGGETQSREIALFSPFILREENILLARAGDQTKRAASFCHQEMEREESSEQKENKLEILGLKMTILLCPIKFNKYNL